MKFDFGKKQTTAHGPCAELDHANATSVITRANPPSARNNSSINCQYPLTQTDTPLENIQRPERAHIRGSGGISTLNRSSRESKESLNECCVPREKTVGSKGKMGLSKTKRILVLLAIDSAFFLLELIVGMKPTLSPKGISC
jgi:hypothetical protein